MSLSSLIRILINGRILGKLVASFVVITTIMALLYNGNHDYNQDTINILMLILGGAVTLLFARHES